MGLCPRLVTKARQGTRLDLLDVPAGVGAYSHGEGTEKGVGRERR